jgi:hypothetical protein
MTTSVTRDIERAYKVLGLHPGAASDEVKRAYRDLAQVWHPDRFAHNSRLQQKAQQNFRRINEAFKRLGSQDAPDVAELPVDPGSTFEAVQSLGDIRDTQAATAPAPPSDEKRAGFEVLDLRDIVETGMQWRRVERRPKRWPKILARTLMLIAVAAAAAVIWMIAT